MPFFHRDSSKDRGRSNPVEKRVDESGINSSLFQRLSRRSRSVDGQGDDHEQGHGQGHSASPPTKVATTSMDPHPRDTLIALSQPQSQPASMELSCLAHLSSGTNNTPVPIRSKSHSASRSKNKAPETAASSHASPDQKRGYLTKEDAQALFSGAPHFMLEQGSRGRYFPQAFFPWNNELEITDLQDRVYSKHRTFYLATLHSHLPGAGQRQDSEDSEGKSPIEAELRKRPTFDMSVYERPNMMGLTGVEVGTLAMRAYLEQPVRDGLNHIIVDKHGNSVHGVDNELHAKPVASSTGIVTVPFLETLRTLAHDEGEANIGKLGSKFNRNDLMKGGPKAWKAVGIRNISWEVLANRLVELSTTRDDLVANGWQFTVLDLMTQENLGKYLFHELLYPPTLTAAGGAFSKLDLKVQIEALVKILTTPGVWVDLSLPRERWLFLERLYTTRPEDQSREDAHGISPSMQRHWNLVQLLLSTELVVRLDAALRLGVASREIQLTPSEIHHFNRLRNLKVDWDLVVARRFSSLTYVKKIPLSTQQLQQLQQLQQVQSSHGHHHEGHGLLHKIKRSHTSDEVEAPYSIGILPRDLKGMAEGLIVFGTHLRWPTIDAVEASLRRKLAVPLQQQEEMLTHGIEPPQGEHVADTDNDTAVVELRSASETTIGGPFSHGWLGGFVLPGYLTPGLLMCTLLENDQEGNPLATLGNKAWTRSGFVWRNRSWWSKTNIVSWIMAPIEGTTEIMGWIALPEDGTPVDSKTGKKFGDGWLLVKAAAPRKLRKGDRIFDGEALAKESTPLGVGHGKILASEFVMITDSVFDKLPKVDVKQVELVLEATDQVDRSDESEKGGRVIYQAAVSAQVSFSGDGDKQAASSFKSISIPLAYEARFVAGHPCRPPHGHVKNAAQNQQDHSFQEHPETVHKHHPSEHLPGHPLHNGFKYLVKSLEEVLSLNDSDWLPNPCDKKAGAATWVIDARGSHPPTHIAAAAAAAATTTGGAGGAGDSLTNTTTGDGDQSASKEEAEGRKQSELQNAGREGERGENKRDEHHYHSSSSSIFPRGKGGPGGLREILARAWCAKVGRDAIVSRVGRQCLACAIREAKALEVAIVIRTGHGHDHDHDHGPERRESR